MKHRVEFAHTDMAGIVHFANYFRYIENTEHAFFRALGLSIHTKVDGKAYGWPRVKASCDYKQPLRFEDEFEVHLLVREKKPKSLTYEFVFRKIGDETGTEIARGSLTAVCVAWDEQTGKMKAATIPAHIADRIEVAPEFQKSNTMGEHNG